MNRSWICVLALFGCGEPSVSAGTSDATGGPATDDGSGTTGSTGTVRLTEGGDTTSASKTTGMLGTTSDTGTGGTDSDTGDEGEDLPGFHTLVYDFSAVETGGVRCSGIANAGATLHAVELAQTHNLAPDSGPWTHNDEGLELADAAKVDRFALVAGRPVFVNVTAVGSGPAPEVRVTAIRSGVEVGHICLAGPKELPATPSEDPNAATRFRGSIDPEWLGPDLELRVTAGDDENVYGPEQLNVYPAVPLEVTEIKMRLFGAAGKLEHFGFEYFDQLARLPVPSILRTLFPVTVEVPRLMLRPSPGTHDALWIEDLEDFAAWQAMPKDQRAHITRETLLITAQICAANGLLRLSKCGSVLTPANNNNKASLGGGHFSTGPSAAQHELSHTLSLGHSADEYNSGLQPVLNPYTGDGNGVGTAWLHEPFADDYVAPWISVDRDGTVIEAMRTTPMGSTVPGEDFANRYYSPHQITRMLLHNSARTFLDHDTGKFIVWDESAEEFQEDTAAVQSAFQREYPIEMHVPVHTVWGTYSHADPQFTALFEPMTYRGHRVNQIDPLDPQQLQLLGEPAHGAVCGWGCDLLLEVTYADGSVARHLVPGVDTRALSSDNPGDPAGYFHFAANFPAFDPLTRVELFYRPLVTGNGTQADASHPANLQVEDYEDALVSVAVWSAD